MMLIVASGKRGHMTEADRVVVVDQGPTASPPAFALDLALHAARRSPCQKSKRGAAVYRAYGHSEPGHHVARPAGPGSWGFNGPPGGTDWADASLCDGSVSCRAHCGERCLHAEQRAIMYLSGDDIIAMPVLRMVHVKVGRDGDLVPGKGPCCHRCASMLLDSGISGCWLYEERPELAALWVYYPARRFYDLAVATCCVYQVVRR